LKDLLEQNTINDFGVVLFDGLLSIEIAEEEAT